MNIENKWALVTGAARRVGKNIAETLSKNGSNIFLHYGRSEEAAIKTANELGENGSEVILIQGNLGEPKEIEAMFSAIQETGNNLDITVNSAASFMKKEIKDTKVEQWDSVQNTNLRAPFLVAKKSAEMMMNNGGTEKGNIIFIADLSGVFTWNGYASHGVSKAGIIHLTKSFAYEFAPDIRVNGVIPGLILPPPSLTVADKEWKSMIENIPLKRDGNPQYVSDTILFMLKNDFMTGNLIYVDGGEHLVGNINHTGK
ncbi:MAG: SDR family oxidoreductase [Candidatus Heimdallarchaeota archaeon]|nr:SDR family oxidoreductase [Candidatus Heimdallarchaeota archaeon]